ncbi:hypothetical protein L6164_027152 [Bauhinia variegata]|uniref:Uncharacterized protein n=1 Tax=Bauhinia variegata TaxID=167791 RepID=A0ACB9LSQ9_BAUVA|nr:hypothetical protein L6164_027152 [Bauhinia variegata]
MASGQVYGASNMTVLLQNDRLPCSSEVLESLWVHPSDPSFHQGSKTLVDFENASNNPNRAFFQKLEKEENVDEDYDACFHQQGKKRRLTSEQVQFLERNFEVENKLEPERKVQFAKELGLQPRQVAIWFQNRRARFKTKQLEKDYGTLKASFDKLKSDFDNLFHENEKLKQEVNSLKDRLSAREKEKEKDSNCDKPSSPDKEALDLISNAVSENGCKVEMVICKQEDANSAKSDVFDSDSPHYTDGNHSTSLFLEPANSSHAFEPDHSDFSQDEEDNQSDKLLNLPCLPKVEDCCYDHDDPPHNSCHFGFLVEDQAFSFWPY